MDSEKPEASATPQNVAAAPTAEAPRTHGGPTVEALQQDPLPPTIDSPMPSDAVPQVGGTVAKDGTLKPASLPSGGELPTTGGWIGRMFNKLNPIKR